MVQKFIFVDSNGYYTESPGAYEETDFISTSAGVPDANKPVKTDVAGVLNTTLMPSTVTLTDGSRPFTGTVGGVTPVAGSDLTTKSYVDSKVISSGQVEEAVLSDEQLNTAQGLLGSEVVYFTALPIANDTISIKNGTVTETYIFKASRTGAFEVTIGATVAIAMQNLVTAISTDSAAWGADYYGAALSSIYTNGAIVIHDKTTSVSPSVSRIYGTFATQSNTKVIEYNGTVQYTTAKPAITIPAIDPGAGRFGINKPLASLINGEIHLVIATDELWEWNGDLSAWMLLASGPVPFATSGPGGAIKGKVSFDENKGLLVNSGVTEVRIDNSTVDFTTSGTVGLLEVKTGGITETQINASAHDATLVGGSGTKLGVNFATTPSDNLAVKESDLSSISGKGASWVGITDLGGYTTFNNVEDALQEIYGKLGTQGGTYNVDTGGVVKGNLVYVSSNNSVKPLPITGVGSNNWGIGLAATTQAAATNVVVTEKTGGVLTGVLSGAVTGTKYFWNGSGYSTSLSGTSGAYVWQVGVARNTSDLAIDVQFIKKNA